MEVEVPATAEQDTYTYTLGTGRKVSHRGNTNDPARRAVEHQQEQPGGKLTLEGRAKTREGALRVEGAKSKTRGYRA